MIHHLFWSAYALRLEWVNGEADPVVMNKNWHHKSHHVFISLKVSMWKIREERRTEKTSIMESHWKKFSERMKNGGRIFLFFLRSSYHPLKNSSLSSIWSYCLDQRRAGITQLFRSFQLHSAIVLRSPIADLASSGISRRFSKRFFMFFFVLQTKQIRTRD